MAAATRRMREVATLAALLLSLVFVGAIAFGFLT